MSFVRTAVAETPYPIFNAFTGAVSSSVLVDTSMPKKIFGKRSYASVVSSAPTSTASTTFLYRPLTYAEVVRIGIPSYKYSTNYKNKNKSREIIPVEIDFIDIPDFNSSNFYKNILKRKKNITYYNFYKSIVKRKRNITADNIVSCPTKEKEPELSKYNFISDTIQPLEKYASASVSASVSASKSTPTLLVRVRGNIPTKSSSKLLKKVITNKNKNAFIKNTIFLKPIVISSLPDINLDYTKEYDGKEKVLTEELEHVSQNIIDESSSNNYDDVSSSEDMNTNSHKVGKNKTCKNKVNSFQKIMQTYVMINNQNRQTKKINLKTKTKKNRTRKIKNNISIHPNNKIKNRNFTRHVHLYSTPQSAQSIAYKYLGRKRTSKLYDADTPEKKYMVFDPRRNKWINFGQIRLTRKIK